MAYTLLDRQIPKHRIHPRAKTIDAAILYAIREGALLTKQYANRLHVSTSSTHPTFRVFETTLNKFLTPTCLDLFSLSDVIETLLKTSNLRIYHELEQRKLRHILSTHETWITSDDLINAFVKDCLYKNSEKEAVSLIFTYTMHHEKESPNEKIKKIATEKSLTNEEKKGISMSTDISGRSAASGLTKELSLSTIFYTIPKDQKELRQSISMYQQSDKTTLVSNQDVMHILPFAYYERDKSTLHILDASQFVEQSIRAIIYHEVFLFALPIFQLLAFLDGIGMVIADSEEKSYSLSELSDLSLFYSLRILKNMILSIAMDSHDAIRLQKSFLELEDIQNTAHEALAESLKNRELEQQMLKIGIWDVVYRLIADF